MMPASQLLRYFINGVAATGVHYACLTLALRGLAFHSAGVANLLGATFGIATSFLGSRYFVFRVFDETLIRQLMRFVLLYSMIACLQAILLFAWSDMMKLDYSVGFLIGILLQFTASFFGSKYLVFRQYASAEVK